MRLFVGLIGSLIFKNIHTHAPAPIPEIATRMARGSSLPAKFGIEVLYKVVGSIQTVPRLKQIEKLEWLAANYLHFDKRLLRLHYGLFLNLLRRAVATKPLVNFLILITDECVVTQGRVNFVCEIFSRKLGSPSLARLLRTMGSTCSPDIYIPPTGQFEVEDAQIPADAILLLASSHNEPVPEAHSPKAAGLCTCIFQCLLEPMSDLELAEHLSQMVPYVEQCGRVFPAVERRVYEYLEKTWIEKYDGNITSVIFVVASRLFRFWPLDRPKIVRERLLKPLLHAQKSCADILIPHLWHFGPLAEETIAQLAKVIRPRGISWYSSHNTRIYLHLYQFYALNTDLKPSSVLVADLIIRQKLYLFLCSLWADLVPAICVSLQGEFSLVGSNESINIIEKLLGGAHKVSSLYSFVNSSWLGGYPQRLYSRVKVQNLSKTEKNSLISSMRPFDSIVHINEETLRDSAGISYSNFCQQLVKDLEGESLHISPYLKEVGG